MYGCGSLFAKGSRSQLGRHHADHDKHSADKPRYGARHFLNGSRLNQRGIDGELEQGERTNDCIVSAP